MKKLAAKILIIDDDSDVLNAARVVLRQKFETVETENNPLRLNVLLRKTRYDVIVLDMNFSAGRISGNEGLFWLKEILSINANQKVILITAYGEVQLAVDAMKVGATDFIVKPWNNDKLEKTVESAVHLTQSKNDANIKSSTSTADGETFSNDIIGSSVLMQNVLRQAKKVAVTDANVLLLGENGTGKELLAKYIHKQSNRADGPFVKVDAGAVAPALFESELFGHKKGSFTDAREERKGRIENAESGTLFMDEIGNLSLDLQSKLLSVLQNREITPVGSNKTIPVNIRLITATNLQIHKAVDEGLFRQDLLFRINTVEITVPALRDRTEDIETIANHFVKVYSTKYRKENRSISPEALKQLETYRWPGNVRELQHAIERAVIMSDHEELTSRDFLFTNGTETPPQKESLNLDEMERKTIITAIQKYQGNMSKVAKELGLGRTTLYRKLARYGLAK